MNVRTLLALVIPTIFLVFEITGHEPEPSLATVSLVCLGGAVLLLGLAGVYWRRLRALQTALACAVASTACLLVPAWLFFAATNANASRSAWVVPVVLLATLAVALLLLTLDRIDHPDRWERVREHARSCGFVDSLLLRDIPNLRRQDETEI